MKALTAIKSTMIAPCGMNCSLCMAFTRKKDPCVGCNTEEGEKRPHCRSCAIRACSERETSPAGHCFECDSFPCRRLKHLDTRYREKYMMSMIDNLVMIKSKGMRAFIAREKKRWTCVRCGGVIDVHHRQCSECGAACNGTSS